MSIKETNKTIAYLTYGALMALGPTLGGYFIGSAIENSKGFDRKVNVKGLSERFIDSDQATFSLKTGHRGDNLNDLYSKIENDKLNILEFLHNLGFEDKSISFSAPKVTDREKSWGVSKMMKSATY